MPDKVISSLEFQLSRWLGKKESKQEVASGCAFSAWLKISVTEQTYSWHQLLLYPLSAEMVGKSCKTLSSSGSCGAEECVQFLPDLQSAC